MGRVVILFYTEYWTSGACQNLIYPLDVVPPDVGPNQLQIYRTVIWFDSTSSRAPLGLPIIENSS